MKSRRVPTYWMLAAVGLALACGLFFFLTHRPILLPAQIDYRTLPAQFNRRLTEQRAAVLTGKNRPDALRGLAHLYQINGLEREGLSCFQILSTEGGLSAQDHYCLADIALQQGDLPGASKELQTVVHTVGSYLPAHIRLGDVAFKSGDSAQAEAQYRAALAIEGGQPQASFGLARIELQRGLTSAAAARLETLVAHHPEANDAIALLAQILARQGNTERAAALTQLSRQKPATDLADPWLDGLFADCFDPQRLALRFEEETKAGPLDRALPLLARIQELDPQSWIPPLLRGWSEDQAHHGAAAEKNYQEALAKGGPVEKIVPLWVACLEAEGNLPLAATTAQEYYTKNPDSEVLLTLYADATLRQNNSALALTLLTELLRRDPYLYWANLNSAKLLWPAGKHDQAAGCLRRIAEIFPADVVSRGWLGQYYLEKDTPLKAIPPLQEALHADSADSSEKNKLSGMLYIAYIQAGNLETQQRQDREAGAHFDAAIELDPNELAGYIGKADLFARLKQFGSAAEVLKKMQPLQPENPTIYLSLGDVFYQDGQPDAAKQQWTRALALADRANTALCQALDQRLSGNITADTFR